MNLLLFSSQPPSTLARVSPSDMHYSWQISALIFAVLFNLGLIVVVRARVRVLATNPFLLGLFLVALWAANYAADLNASDLDTKVWLLRLRFLFLPFFGMVWFETSHRFALGRKFLYGRRLALASVVPIVTVLFVWLPLPPRFQLMLLPGFRVETLDGIHLLHFSLGPWSIVVFAHIVGFLTGALWVLWRTRRDTPWERDSHLIMIGAFLLGILLNVLFVLGFLRPAGLNYGPLLSPVTTGLVALAMLRGRVFSLAPVARATLIENLEERLVVLDANDLVVDFNRAAGAALGATPEKAMGKPAELVLAPWPEVVAQLRKNTTNKAEVQIAGLTYELTVHAVSDNPADRRARILMLRDVTQRRRDEEDLRRAKEAAEAATEAKSRFLATMTHEVRTPMNSVLGFAQLLQDGPLNPEQREYLDHIIRSGRSLIEIIEGVLNYSQITSGNFTLKETRCAPSELVAQAGEPLLPQAHARNITLRWSVGAGVPDTIMGDPLRIGQIISTLVNNAVKFTERGGIDVEIVAAGDGIGLPDGRRCTLDITVRDTGIGITPEVAGRIFQPFVQGDNSLTRRYGGVGLGLAIAEKLCEAMGGRLTMNSEPGQGSTFTARITVGRVPEDSAEAVPGKPNAG
jgi:signal transduction histidine kinase